MTAIQLEAAALVEEPTPARLEQREDLTGFGDTLGLLAGFAWVCRLVQRGFRGNLSGLDL